MSNCFMLNIQMLNVKNMRTLNIKLFDALPSNEKHQNDLNVKLSDVRIPLECQKYINVEHQSV